MTAWCGYDDSLSLPFVHLTVFVPQALCQQAIAVAALFLACKVPELSGSAVQSEGNDPLMADFDRGHLAVVVRASLEWVAFHEHQRSAAHGRPQVKINIPVCAAQSTLINLASGNSSPRIDDACSAKSGP